MAAQAAGESQRTTAATGLFAEFENLAAGSGGVSQGVGFVSHLSDVRFDTDGLQGGSRQLRERYLSPALAISLRLVIGSLWSASGYLPRQVSCPLVTIHTH